MMSVDRMDAITELYRLGTEAEELIGKLAEAQDLATNYRLSKSHILAGEFNNQATMLAAELEKIGQRQNAILGQLEAAGEIIYL